MSTNKGDSGQEQDNGYRPAVTWHEEPGYFYRGNNEEQQGTENGQGIIPNAPKSAEIHYGAQVNQIDSQNIKERMITTITQDTDNNTKITANNGGDSVNVSEDDIEYRQPSQSSSSRITEDFERVFKDGSADDYNRLGTLSVDSKNGSNLQIPVGDEDKMNNDTQPNDGLFGEPDDSSNQAIEHNPIEKPANTDATLGQDEESSLLAEKSKKIVELKGELSKAQEQLSKEKLILKGLLADQKALSRQTGFLKVKNESVDSLVAEIKNKNEIIKATEKGIAEIEQQITEINQPPEQPEVQTQEKTEVAVQTPMEDVAKARGENIVRKKSDLMNGRDDGMIEKKQVSEGLDKVMTTSNTENIETEEVIYEIKNGQTLLETIKEGILMLGVDKDETDGMGLKALGEFKVEQLKKSIAKNITKGMPQNMAKKQALSSWGEVLDKLKPGDKVIVSLSKHGVKLDIPVISNSKLNIGKTMSSNNVADDYNLAQVA